MSCCRCWKWGWGAARVVFVVRCGSGLHGTLGRRGLCAPESSAHFGGLDILRDDANPDPGLGLFALFVESTTYTLLVRLFYI